MKVWTHQTRPSGATGRDGVPAHQSIRSIVRFATRAANVQLQDLAVGYGGSIVALSRRETRRVFASTWDALVAAEEMTRCIQCTRCVASLRRFSGFRELGMVGRGEHAGDCFIHRQDRRVGAVRKYD
jgi:hypothetical protein